MGGSLVRHYRRGNNTNLCECANSRISTGSRANSTRATCDICKRKLVALGILTRPGGTQ